jgi:hypothetical protein
MDGYGSPDVLQTGTSVDVTCPDNGNSGSTTSYHAWLEWFPNYEVAINNLPVRPGDIFNVSVVDYDSTHGLIVIENQTINQTVALQLTPPAGTTLQGNSVEWIVERYSINNQITNLPDYVSLAMNDATAQSTAGNVYYPGSVPGGTIYSIVMLSNGGARVSQATVSSLNQTVPFSLSFISTYAQ